MKSNKVYSDMLWEIFNENYVGYFSEGLVYIPKFFDLLQKIYRSPELDWEKKFRINCCFGYFAAPLDIIPDDSRRGYIDDLYLCVYVLNDLLDESPDLVKDNWTEGEDIEQLIKEILCKTSIILANKTREILHMVGLIKFKEICSNKNLITESVDINDKVKRINYDIQQIVALIKTSFIAQGKTLHIRRLNDLKALFTEKQWEKVVKILERVEIHESKYDNLHEIEIEKIKRDVLLDLDESLMEELK